MIDCTEVKIQGSSNFDQQGHMYSSYKQTQTMKAFIGVTPGGAAAFVSDAFEGSISDKEITKKCGFLEGLIPGDGVLAGKKLLRLGSNLEKYICEKVSNFLMMLIIFRSWIYN